MRKLILHTIILAIPVFFVAESSAQILRNNSEPEVIVVNNGGNRIDTVSIESIIELYRSTQRRGFGHLGMPGFVITGQNRNFLLGIGGNVSVRGTYDFDGISDSRDFVTSAIPVPNNARQRQQYMIDPTASTIFLKGVVDSERFGPITGYVEANFRGYDGTGLYLRKAYVTIGGFFIGRYYTSFCDTRAAPSTVDYEGPSYMPLLFRTMIQYNLNFGSGWSAGIALESPNVTATAGNNFSLINQRMPDIPAYVQYEWNETRSHIRLAGVFREMIYWNEISDKRMFHNGWGVHLSGALQIGERLTAYYGGIYGRGLGGYMQDISGTGLDLVYDSRNTDRMQTLPMAGWNGGLQYSFDSGSKWIGTVAYSGVKIFPNDGFRESGAYTLGQYLSTNLFYNLTSNCQLGFSYMYGLRKNMDDQKGHANRLQAVVQYNF